MKLFELFAPMERQVTVNGIRFTIGYSQEDNASRARVDLMSIPTLSDAIEIKANDVSQIPLHVFLKTDAGRMHQSGRVDYQLSTQPNRYQNAATFWKLVGIQATLGECFVSTRDQEFNILPFGACVRYITAQGEVRYATTYTKTELEQRGMPGGGVVIKDDYAWNEVLHFYTFTDEFGIPVPLRARFRHILGLGSDLYGYMTKVYNRGGTLVGYLSTDKPIQDKQKINVIQAFKKLFKAAANTDQSTGTDLGIAALDQGWKYNRVDLTPNEMMLIETKQDLVQDFAQIVNMPLWKLGIVKDYHYSTAEVAQREYIVACLNPLLYQIEKEIKVKLYPGEDDRRYVEFNRDAIVYLDASTAATIDNTYLQNGTKLRNEVRDRLNLPRLPNGDMQQVPVNVQSSDYTIANEAFKLKQLQAQTTALEKGNVDNNQLRTTVGGVTALTAMQTAYSQGQLPRSAAMAAGRLLYGFSEDEAESLFPEVQSKGTVGGFDGGTVGGFNGGTASPDLPPTSPTAPGTIVPVAPSNPEPGSAPDAGAADAGTASIAGPDSRLGSADSGSDATGDISTADPLPAGGEPLHTETPVTSPTPAAATTFGIRLDGSPVNAAPVPVTPIRNGIPVTDPSLDETARVNLSLPNVYLASLQKMQEHYAKGLNVRNIHCLRTMVNGVVGDVAKMYELDPTELRSWSLNYLEAAQQRCGKDPAPSVAYEVNRAINATNYEAMVQARGRKAKVQWHGGAHDLEVRSLDQAWDGKLHHPPLSDTDTASFLVLA